MFNLPRQLPLSERLVPAAALVAAAIFAACGTLGSVEAFGAPLLNGAFIRPDAAASSEFLLTETGPTLTVTTPTRAECYDKVRNTLTTLMSHLNLTADLQIEFMIDWNSNRQSIRFPNLSAEQGSRVVETLAADPSLISAFRGLYMHARADRIRVTVPKGKPAKVVPHPVIIQSARDVTDLRGAPIRPIWIGYNPNMPLLNTQIVEVPRSLVRPIDHQRLHPQLSRQPFKMGVELKQFVPDREVMIGIEAPQHFFLIVRDKRYDGWVMGLPVTHTQAEGPYAGEGLIFQLQDLPKETVQKLYELISEPAKCVSGTCSHGVFENLAQVGIRVNDAQNLALDGSVMLRRFHTSGLVDANGKPIRTTIFNSSEIPYEQWEANLIEQGKHMTRIKQRLYSGKTPAQITESITRERGPMSQEAKDVLFASLGLLPLPPSSVKFSEARTELNMEMNVKQEFGGACE